MCLAQQKHVVDLHLDLDVCEPLCELSDANRHVRDLLLGQKPRMVLRSIRIVGRLVRPSLLSEPVVAQGLISRAESLLRLQ